MGDFVTDRRTMIGAGALLAGAGAMVAPSTATAQSGAGAWQPQREALDNWLDNPVHKHRMVFDTASADQAQASLGYANNCYFASDLGYGLKPQELGMVLILRHGSTVFGYNDAMWKKYGRHFVDQLQLKGNDAVRGNSVNPMFRQPDDTPPPPKGYEKFSDVSLSDFGARGAMFAICGLATKGIAGGLAGKTKGDADAIEKELKANLIPGGHIVAAGILAVNRAQERGYTLALIAD